MIESVTNLLPFETVNNGICGSFSHSFHRLSLRNYRSRRKQWIKRSWSSPFSAPPSLNPFFKLFVGKFIWSNSYEYVFHKINRVEQLFNSLQFNLRFGSQGSMNEFFHLTKQRRRTKSEKKIKEILELVPNFFSKNYTYFNFFLKSIVFIFTDKFRVIRQIFAHLIISKTAHVGGSEPRKYFHPVWPESVEQFLKFKSYWPYWMCLKRWYSCWKEQILGEKLEDRSWDKNFGLKKNQFRLLELANVVRSSG